MIVILDNLRSALNVGSIIRTCDGLGIRDVCICGITPEIEDKKVLKTSLGAEKNINAKYFEKTLDAAKKAKQNGYKIIGLEILERSIPVNEINAERVALVVGNEVSGISKDVLNICDMVASIPMKGNKESFNASIAFAIAAYEITS